MLAFKRYMKTKLVSNVVEIRKISYRMIILLLGLLPRQQLDFLQVDNEVLLQYLLIIVFSLGFVVAIPLVIIALLSYQRRWCNAVDSCRYKRFRTASNDIELNERSSSI